MTTNTDIVTIAVATQPTMGINFNNATTGVFSFGGINFNNGTNRVLGNSSGSASGVLTLNGATINSVSNVIIRNAGAGNFTFQATQSGGGTMGVALGSTTNNVVSVDSTGNVVFDSIISSQSGTTPFTVRGSGSGRVDITNTANTFTGTINLLGAETRFTSANSYGNVNNTIVIDGGRLATASATSYTLASTHGIQVGDTAGTSISVVTSGTLTYGGVISNVTGKTGAWAKQGAGTLALGGVSTYTGDTAINNGNVQLTTGNDRLPTGTTVSLGQAASTNLGTFDLNARNQQIAGLNSTTGTNATASDNTVTSSTAATLTLGGSGSYSYGDGTNANSGIITGAISLVKSGSGTQTLGDANTYSGTTAVNVGVLNVRHATALGNTTGGTSVTSGAALEIQGGITVGAEALTLNGTGVSAAGALRNISGTNTFGGLITLGSAARINSDAGSLSLTNSGTITGSGFGLTVGGAADTSIAGIIGTGAGTLTKDGAGTLTLTGANTYSGATTISTGTLTLGSTASINNSTTIDVQSGATFSVGSVNSGYSLATGQTLNGLGTVTGAMTVASGATLSPGSSPGTLLHTGNETWNGGGNYNWQLYNATGTAGAANGWDLVDIAGSLTIAATVGNKFNLNLWSLSGVGPDVNGDSINFNNANNYAWKIAAASGGISGFAADAFNISTAITNGTAGFSNALNGGTFSVSQSGNDLNLVFTAAATGTNLYWNGSGNWVTSSPGAGGNGTWANATGGWDPDKTANFSGASGAVTVTTATANKGINFLADGYTLSGGTLTLSATPADNVITVGSAMTATVSSAIATSAGVIKAGAGNLIFNTTQAYTGGTTVNAGTLTLGHATNILADGEAVTVSGGTLDTSTNTDTVGSFTITSGTLGGTGTLTATTYALNGGTITGNLGAGAATASTGTTSLNGTLAANLTVSGGSVNLGSADRLGNASAVSISSGTLGMGANNDTVGTFAITGGTLGGSGTLTASTCSLGGGTVTANLGAGAATASSGTTALNGTLAADLTVSGGTVNLGSADRLGDSSAVSISSGTLGISTFNDTVGSFALSGTGTLGGTSGVLTAATYNLGGGTVTANLGAGAATASSGTTALDGTLAADLAVSGGTVNLGSADRLGNSSAVSISSGTLGISTFNDTVGSFALSGGSLGGSTGILTAATYALQGGTVDAKLGAGSVTVTTGTTTLGSAARLGATSTVAVNSGQLVLGGDETVSSYTQSGGTLGGSGTLTASTYALNGATVTANLGTGTATAASGSTALNGTLGGNLTVSGGTVTLGAADRIANSGAVSVSSGALNLGGNADTVGAVSTTGGTISNGTLNGSSYALNGGTISAALSGSGAITATSGTTTLSANSSGFSGNTAVNGGTLALGSSGALGSSAVSMSSGSVLATAGTTNTNNITIGSTGPGVLYSQNFNAIGSGLPTGWTVRTVATASALGSTATLNTTAADWGATTGQFANFAASTGLSSGSLSAAQTASTDRALGVRQTGSFGDPGAAFNYSFATTGQTIDSIALNLMMLSVQTRSTTWAIQYGIGASPSSFTTLGTYSDPGSFGSTTVTYTTSDFGTNLNNQSDLVFRVVALTSTTGTGNRDTFGIDNFTINNIVSAAGSGTIGINEAGSTTFGGNISINGAATLTAAAGGTANFSGNLTGTGATISKTGSGSVVLTGTNTYTGVTTISAGTLQVGNGGTTGSLGSTSGVTNDAALVFNRSNALTVSPVISGTGSVTQAGTGTTSLSNDNTYTGTTTITAGVLRLNSASALSGGIGSSGGTSGLTLNGGVLGLGVGDFTRALGTGAAQVQFTGSGGFAAYGADRTVNFGGAGATVIWNSGSFVPTGSSLILGAADSDKKITLQNAIDFGGATRTIQVIKGTATGAGVYDAKLAGALSNGSYTQTGDGRLEVAGAITGTTFDQSAENGTLALTSTITTTGAFTQSGTGSTTTVSGSGSISAASFTQSGTGSATTVTGAGSITAGTFTQSGTGSATTVTGAGSIISTSAANLTAGTVTLSSSAANTAFIAPIINIGGAALVLGASDQIANDTIVVLTSGSVGWTGSNHSETVGTFTNSGGTFVTGANTLIGTGATITWSGGTNTVSDGGNVQDAHLVISGGTNTVEGGATGGMLQLNTGGAGLEMSNGSTLTLNSDNAVAGKLLLKGNVSTSGDSTITIASGLANTNKGNVDLDSGTRTFTVANGAAANDLLVSSVILNGAVTKAGAGKMTVTAANTYTGNTTINEGTLQLGNGGTTGSLSTSSAITNNGTLTINRSNAVSQGNDFSGSTIAGTGGLTQAGSGTTTLTAANTYSGNTVVSAGKLEVNNTTGSGTGTGTVTVQSGATLQGTGTITGLTTIQSAAFYEAGTASTVGTLNFTAATVENGSQGGFHLAANGVNDRLNVTGSGQFTVGTTAAFKVFLDYTPTATDFFDLLDWVNAIGGDTNIADNLIFDIGDDTPGAGLAWDTSTFNTDGVLRIAAVPEPSRVLLLAAGMAGLLLRRRRSVVHVN